MIPWLMTSVCLLAATSAHDNEAVRYNYMLHCQGCHLADATGNEPAVPSMVNQLGEILKVPDGRAYLVQVPGVSQAPLSGQETADLLNWILRRFNADSLPQDFSPYTAAEVADLLAQRSGDIATRRRDIISAIGARR